MHLSCSLDGDTIVICNYKINHKCTRRTHFVPSDNYCKLICNQRDLVIISSGPVSKLSYIANGKTDMCILRCTDNSATTKILDYCFESLLQNCPYSIIVSEKKPDVQGWLVTYYRQLLECCNACGAKYVFICEHDVLYHPSHFDFKPEEDDVFYYNSNVLVLSKTGSFINSNCHLSQCICTRELLIKALRERIDFVLNGGNLSYCEPGCSDPKTQFRYDMLFKSEVPNIDIRHHNNLTGNRGMVIKDYMSTLPYWGNLNILRENLAL